jgi:hypothetical protein
MLQQKYGDYGPRGGTTSSYGGSGAGDHPTP